MKELKLIIFPIILFLFLVGMVFVFTSGTLSSLLPTFEQAPEDTGIIADVTYSFNPGDNIEGWENGYPWKEFILSYTDNWKVNEVTKDEAKGKLAVSFQNADGSYFDIIQGVSDGCTQAQRLHLAEKLPIDLGFFSLSDFAPTFFDVVSNHGISNLECFFFIGSKANFAIKW